MENIKYLNICCFATIKIKIFSLWFEKQTLKFNTKLFFLRLKELKDVF